MEKELKKIIFFDLREEFYNGGLCGIVGRLKECKQALSVARRRIDNNLLIVGDSGIGKSSTMIKLAKSFAENQSFTKYKILKLDEDHLRYFDNVNPKTELFYRNAFESVSNAIVFVDNFGKHIYKDLKLTKQIFNFYNKLFLRKDIVVILSMLPYEYAWIKAQYPAFLQNFETITLEEDSPTICKKILSDKIKYLNKENGIIITDSAIERIIYFTKQYKSLGNMPYSCIKLLDECIGKSQEKNEKVLSKDTIEETIELKIRLPNIRFSDKSVEEVKNIEKLLKNRITGQDKVMEKIASTLQISKLGIKSSDSPIVSFLLLGPSGVGKTQTAKLVAEIMFGSEKNIIRLDMSEFQQEHSVEKLLGAPPGYVGYEEGGVLIEALKKSPHSIILLDEIEKANTRVFDVFLQLIDEGRITSGKGELVNLKDSIIMATSNIGAKEVLKFSGERGFVNSNTFIKDIILPALLKTFRAEFINRFDDILVFDYLNQESLLKIAEQEIIKIKNNIKNRNIEFELDKNILAKKIETLYDKRFGARPIKRFVQNTCETMLKDLMLKNK